MVRRAKRGLIFRPAAMEEAIDRRTSTRCRSMPDGRTANGIGSAYVPLARRPAGPWLPASDGAATAPNVPSRWPSCRASRHSVLVWRWVVMGSLLLALVASAPQSAEAAGAESARLTGPDIESPVDLLAQEPDLPALTGAWFAAAGEDVTPLMQGPPTTLLGRRLTLTWVMRGPPELPREERSVIQHVYPEAEGGPLIETPKGQGVWEGAVGWYVAPDEFGALLADLGLGAEDEAEWPRFVPVAAGATVVLALASYQWRRRRQQEQA